MGIHGDQLGKLKNGGTVKSDDLEYTLDDGEPIKFKCIIECEEFKQMLQNNENIYFGLANFKSKKMLNVVMSVDIDEVNYLRNADILEIGGSTTGIRSTAFTRELLD